MIFIKHIPNPNVGPQYNGTHTISEKARKNGFASGNINIGESGRSARFFFFCIQNFSSLKKKDKEVLK